MTGPSPIAPPTLLLIGLAGTLFLAIRVCRRYRTNLSGAGRPQASWGIWAVLIVLICVLLGTRPGTLRHPVRGAPGIGDLSMPPWLVPALLGAILLVSIGGYVRACFRPGTRIARLIARGRFDAAEALIRGRLARRQAGQHGPGAEGNPYAAPASSGHEAERQAETEDWNNLGLIALDRRDWPEAIACFERAEAIGLPDDFSLRNNRGLALIAAGRVDEGTALVEQAIAEMPSDQAEDCPHLNLVLAERLIEAGRLDRAGPILDRAATDLRRTPVPGRSSRRGFADRLAAARAQLAAAQAAPPSEGSAA